MRKNLLVTALAVVVVFAVLLPCNAGETIVLRTTNIHIAGGVFITSWAVTKEDNGTRLFVVNVENRSRNDYDEFGIRVTLTSGNDSVGRGEVHFDGLRAGARGQDSFEMRTDRGVTPIFRLIQPKE